MVQDNAVNQNAVEERTSSLWSIRAAHSANRERPMHSSREEQLAQAKASRTQAETTRKKIANEILEATKGACQKLITSAEQTLQRAKMLEAEGQQETRVQLEKAKATRAEAEVYAEKVKSEAQEQLDQAQNIRREADAHREKVITAATEQGQEILCLARSSAEQECNEMKHQASLEAQRIIAEAELIEAAAEEELEAQRIYAEAARLETESLEVLAQVREKSGEQMVLPQVASLWKDATIQGSSMPDLNLEEEVSVKPVKSPRSRKNRVPNQKE